MAYFDYPLDQLKSYLPDRQEPNDFDDFWRQTLNETRAYPLKANFEAVDCGLETVEAFDVTFSGYAGQPVKGWLMLPRQRAEKLPCVVEYIGYGGGRGFPIDWLLWSSAGFAHLIMDTRGQGSVWRKGDTPDIQPDGSSPHTPGFMTLGIEAPKTYYYRRVFADAVRAVEAALSHPVVDAKQVAITGGSQGGGISLAVAGLSSQVFAILPDVPFLCHYRRATEIIDTYPYQEISTYCKIHRGRVEQVFDTLAYFDGLNFAVRSQAQALFSVGLMDDICPPSTVFAAYNYYRGPKEIRIYPYNHHEGGESFQAIEKVRFLKRLVGNLR